MSEKEGSEPSQKQSHVLESFELDGENQPVRFIETMNVKAGVQCDVYEFESDETKDLGIIRIERGHQTPLQRVLKGDSTAEGHISGRGKLTITKESGEKKEYEVSDGMEEPFSIEVKVGELMKWKATANSDLVVCEVCYPPYEDGRFENITD